MDRRYDAGGKDLLPSFGHAHRRAAQGLTQQQLAELLGIFQQHVPSYEVGRRKVAKPKQRFVMETLEMVEPRPAAKERS